MSTRRRTKKDDVGGKEGFDPVTIDLHQAESALLMLKSPENDVKIHACEALYKFASKNDNNKRLLLNKDLCQNLLPLLSSEDKVVKRNAAMVLGIISSCNEAVSIIQTLPDHLTALRKLLNQEEYDNTREFTLLILKNLFEDFWTVNEALQEKLVQPIVNCLNCSDPDVKKNALDTLLKISKDFEVRSTLAVPASLEVLFEQLNSEYPSIQDTTLQLFACLTQDSQIRSKLQKMNAFEVFIELLGKPELNDLHLATLSVVEHLLEDPNCVKDLLGSGKLHVLFRFIADREMKIEADQQMHPGSSPTKGKGGSQRKASLQKSPRKGKQEPSAKKHDEKPAVAIRPEAKIYACHAISRASRNADVRRILHDGDVEQMLVHLLYHEDHRVRSAAAQTIVVLSESSICQERISQLGGLEWLVRMTCSEQHDVKSAGAMALAALTTGNTAICRDLADRGSGIESLLSCLAFREPEMDAAVAASLTALTSLALDEVTRSKVLLQITGKEFVPCLLSTSTVTQAKAALATAAMVCEPLTVAEFCEHDGVQALVQLLHSPVPDVFRSACWATFTLGSDKQFAKLFAKYRGIEQLLSLNESTSKRNQFTATALHRMLDSNLPIKFALTGRLDFGDNIEDRFYDPGSVRSISDILSLSEYMAQPLNDRRPIYLISIGEESPAGNVHQENLANIHQDNRDGVPKEYSEDIQDEDEASEDKMAKIDEVILEVDEKLVQWLEYANIHIKPLIDTCQQVQKLAEFVASRYGGSVKKEELEAFRPELAMADLRCQRQSNVIPIGEIEVGSQLHRALLFKFLADRIGLPTTLVRGNYGKSYNEIALSNESSSKNPTTYIVDLMFFPGTLIEDSSRKALEYVSLF